MPKHGATVLLVGLTLISADLIAARQPTESAQPTPAHKKLAAFVGTWKDEAEVKPGPFGPGGKMSLTETCGWFTGAFSLVCRTESTGFMGDLKTLTVLTYDPEEQVYRFYEFNSAGRVFAAKGTVNADTWTFDGEAKVANKLIKTHFTIKISTPDSALVTSEASVDGGPMTPVMELTGTRVKQSLSNLDSCVHGSSEGWPFECLQNSLSR